MTYVTLLQYTDEDGQHHDKTVDWFNSTTSFNDIEKRIKDELNISSFKLKIKDPDDRDVDFSDYYLKSFRPFGVNEETGNSGAQPTTAPPRVVDLLIIQTSGKKY